MNIQQIKREVLFVCNRRIQRLRNVLLTSPSTKCMREIHALQDTRHKWTESGALERRAERIARQMAEAE
jgi:hypothetical protein